VFYCDGAQFRVAPPPPQSQPDEERVRVQVKMEQLALTSVTWVANVLDELGFVPVMRPPEATRNC
jgi:hypothetical protein